MIPKDPVMLLSFMNMKLRDEYDSLEDLCKSLDVEMKEICAKLQQINYSYNEEQNQFI